MGENLTRKVIRAHLAEGRMVPGEEIGICIDQTIIQDRTGTQAVMHFEAMSLPRIRCKVAVAYADHTVLHINPDNMEDHIYVANAAGGDVLEIPEVGDLLAAGKKGFTLRNVTKPRKVPVRVGLKERQRAYTLAGGHLAYTKHHPIV